MTSGVYRPYILVPRENKPIQGSVSDNDRQAFTIIDYVMGSHRNWIGVSGQLSPAAGSGRVLGMGSAGMSPEELRVRRFMESCTFKAMFSCAGGE